MLWEYLILGVVLVWALFYLWRTFFKKKGCSCDSCPAAPKDDGSVQGLGDLRGDRKAEGGNRLIKK